MAIPELQVMSKLLLASLLGALIGLEREVHGRPAGFRTHLLVSLGSCLFVIVSIDFYRMYGNFSGGATQVGVDPGRIAAQVVTGIGFLGAGAIIRDKATVRGLTTAACLWVASAIGLACGAGRYAPAIAVTVLAFLSLLMLKKVEKRLKRDTYICLKVWSDDMEGQVARVEHALQLFQVEILEMSINKDVEKHRISLYFQLRYHTRKIGSELADGIAGIEGVRKIWIE